LPDFLEFLLRDGGNFGLDVIVIFQLVKDHLIVIYFLPFFLEELEESLVIGVEGLQVGP
jgi:hypothetical protein